MWAESGPPATATAPRKPCNDSRGASTPSPPEEDLVDPHVLANRRLEQLTDLDRRRRDARTARLVSRVRLPARRRSGDG
jgi:hypothetical protein